MRCYARKGGLDELAAQLQIGTNALYKRLERIRRTLFECMDKDK